MKSRFFILIFCTFYSFYSFAENTPPKKIDIVNSDAQDSGLNKILQHLKKNKILRSQFKQTRHLKILSRPLLSEGQLNYFSGKGIIWEIEKPIKSKVIISPNKITEINVNREPISRPNFGGIYTVLDALLNGNAAIINKNFTINFEGSTENWHIELTPRFSPLDKIFKTIEMHGKHQINRIILNDNNQDSTIITLISTQKKPSSISPAEEAYFAL